MDHLTEGQFEELLAGNTDRSSHIDTCITCQRRLSEKEALAGRLRSAFSSIHAGHDLAERIRGQLSQSEIQISEPQSNVRIRFLDLHRRLVSILAAAAAVLIVLVPVGLYLSTSSQAHAAQIELVKIHQHNMKEPHGFVPCSDPNTLTAYFAENLGHVPACVCTGRDITLRGCCVHEYRGQRVGSYIVDTAQGRVSVVTLSDTPEMLRMKLKPTLSSPEIAIWVATCDCCNMAARRLEGRTYYALGDVSQETLANVLKQLL